MLNKETNQVTSETVETDLSNHKFIAFENPNGSLSIEKFDLDQLESINDLQSVLVKLKGNSCRILDEKQEKMIRGIISGDVDITKETWTDFTNPFVLPEIDLMSIQKLVEEYLDSYKAAYSDASQKELELLEMIFTDMAVLIINGFSTSTIREVLESPYAKFRYLIYPLLAQNEEVYESLYKGNRHISALLVAAADTLRIMLGMAEDKFINQMNIDFTTRWALHSEDKQELFHDRGVLERFRKLLVEYEKINGVIMSEKEIRSLNVDFIETFAIVINRFRIDSSFIDSNIRNLNRTELFYVIARDLAKDLLRAKVNLTSHLTHYGTKSDYNKVFYHDKRNSKSLSAEKVLDDVVALMALFSEELKSNQSYLNAIRVLDEQCNLTEDGYVLKSNSNPDDKVPSNALQTPADLDATYRSKNEEEHQGYLTCILEGEGSKGDEHINLVLDAHFYQNIVSDHTIFKEILQDDILQQYQLLGCSGISPEEKESLPIHLDGGFFSAEVEETASKLGYTLIPSGLVGRITPAFEGQFELSSDGKTMITCPQGLTPDKSTYGVKGKTVNGTFSQCLGEECPFYKDCLPKRLKNGKFSRKVRIQSHQRAKRQAQMNTEDYSKLIAYRNGIEAFFSLLNRRNVHRLPVRGLAKVRYYTENIELGIAADRIWDFITARIFKSFKQKLRA